ncbi:carbohydrate ABC transporter permease [Afifella sp. IM 167]|uniref:carbohydrate ABC transporter permease n=1 Tax=Afifella sp. IM 167 TaxID=2033586 RepID=UPI001CCCFD7F|nr:sugar ABC transporter permease [Afifella sp. IM 167]MBZ8134954.1 sugar ABC transporter permease [Afifella sp. IM 167]
MAGGADNAPALEGRRRGLAGLIPGSRKRSRDLALIWLFLAPSLAIFAIYRIVPLIWNAVLSFQFWSPYKPAEFAGLYHYEEMLFYDDAFWQTLWNTLIFMASAPVGIVFALAVALLVDTNIRGRNVYRTIFFMSYPVMTVAVGIIWQWLFNENVGLINYVLIELGIIDRGIPFLESFDWALPSVILASIWQVIGFYMIILLTGLQSIPPSLYEAAAIDGANALQRFRRITLPLIRPSLFLCFVVGIINSFTAFDLIFVMTGGGPGHATDLLITYIYSIAFRLSKFDYAAAITVVNFLLFLALAFLANRLAGGEAGAVKTGG